MAKDTPQADPTPPPSYATVAEALQASYDGLSEQHGPVKRCGSWKYGADYQRVQVAYNGGGTVIPLHRCADKRWRIEDPPDGVPLYHLDEIINHDKRVVVVQGERAADAVRQFHFVATTGAPDTDWRPLSHRRVVVWRDNNRAGVSWQTEVVAILTGIKAIVAVVQPPDGFADIIGFVESGRGDIQGIIDEAEPVLTPQETDEPTTEQRRSLVMFAWTDYGNAERLVHRHGEKIRYCAETGKWYIWCGNHWRPDNTRGVTRAAKDTMRELLRIALRMPKDKKHEADELIKYARRSEHHARLAAMVKLAESERPVVVRSEDLDADPWALNVRNGTIDLRTGTLHPHDPAELHTKLAPVTYDPDADCPVFDRFLAETTCGSAGLTSYLLQTLGMCLTGIVREQILPVWYGQGANGKSTLIDLMLHIMGDYAGLAAPELLVAKRWSEHPTEIADLQGKRLVVASETERNQRLRVQFVKAVTGDAKLKARFMRQDFFEFERQFKLILVTNNKPVVDEQSHAIWRRLKLVPFSYIVPDSQQDAGLLGKLTAEAPGILARLVKGCRDWDQNGLIQPEEVGAATEEYRAESNWLDRFIEECLHFAPYVWCPSKKLADTLDEWCRENGIEHAAINDVHDRLRQHHDCKSKKYQGARGWTGVSISEDIEP